jgi:hypothetical protein
MHVHVQWTRFNFTPPEAIEAAIYDQLRSAAPPPFVKQHLRATLRSVAIALALLAGAAAILFAVGAWLDTTLSRRWAAVTGTALMTAVIAAVLSMILTGGSYLKYAANYTNFWRQATRLAQRHDSYEFFAAAYAQERSEIQGLDRKMPSWFSLALLVAAVAVGIYVLNRFG